MSRILLLEDDATLGRGVRFALETEGVRAELCAGLAEARALLAQGPFDLLVLDVNLPEGSGLDLLREVRRSGSGVPVILLTANDLETDIVMGLESGADDYVTKPFSPSELTARVDAVYRRVALAAERYETQDQVAAGEFILNLRDRSFTKGGAPIELTQVEFQIMEYFLENPGIALARGDILRHVWGPSYVGEEKIVDVNIRRLRMKVEDEPSNPQHITTVWGLGYRWKT